jgi:transcription elongation factor GreA
LIKDMQSLLPVAPSDAEAEAFALLDGVANPVEVISEMTMPEYQTRAAGHLREIARDRWPERAEEIFLNGPMRLAQWVLRDLLENGNAAAASHMAEQLVHRSHLNPDLFLWTVRTVRGGKWTELRVEMPSETLLSGALELIEDCRRRIDREDPDASGLRGLQSRLSNLLMENHHAIVTDAFLAYETQQARERYRTLMNNPALSDSFKVSLDHALRTVRDDLDEAKTAGGTQGGEHFVTAAAFEAKQKEYQHLKNEEIPAISKAIGDAARMGDLSENAEYHSAKERQKVMFRRLEQLEDLLQRARLLDPTHIQTDSIGVGTAFEVRNLDSAEIERYELLGVWDTDPDKHILSYLTPFGKQFLNRKVGDTLIVNDPGGGATRYEVLSISNALAIAQ